MNKGFSDLQKLEISKKPNLSDLIVDRLKQAIFSGELPAGARLVEENLANMLQVSKTPLREALSVLQREGLIDTFPSQGKFVASITPKQLIETYVVRDVIESLSASLAVHNADSALDHRMKELYEDSADALEKNEITRFLKGDEELHKLLLEYAKNDSLTCVYELLTNRIRLGKVSTAYKEVHLHDSLSEHAAIIEQIVARDPDGAANAMHRHIQSIISLMQDVFKES